MIDGLRHFINGIIFNFRRNLHKETRKTEKEIISFQPKYQILPNDNAIFPIKIVEVDDGYIAVFDSEITPQKAEVWIINTHDGRYAAFLIFDNLYWIPLEELNFEQFNNGFNLYLAGSSKHFFTARIEHRFEIKNERYMHLYMLRLSTQKANQNNGGPPRDRILFVRDHIPQELRFRVH